MPPLTGLIFFLFVFSLLNGIILNDSSNICLGAEFPFVFMEMKVGRMLQS